MTVSYAASRSSVAKVEVGGALNDIATAKSLLRRWRPDGRNTEVARPHLNNAVEKLLTALAHLEINDGSSGVSSMSDAERFCRLNNVSRKRANEAGFVVGDRVRVHHPHKKNTMASWALLSVTRLLSFAWFLIPWLMMQRWKGSGMIRSAGCDKKITITTIFTLKAFCAYGLDWVSTDLCWCQATMP
jgi:hypothetical protein